MFLNRIALSHYLNRFLRNRRGNSWSCVKMLVKVARRISVHPVHIRTKNLKILSRTIWNASVKIEQKHFPILSLDQIYWRSLFSLPHIIFFPDKEKRTNCCTSITIWQSFLNSSVENIFTVIHNILRENSSSFSWPCRHTS